MENKKQKIQEEKIADTEKNPDEDVAKTEEKAEQGRITQKQADKEVENKVKEDINKIISEEETSKGSKETDKNVDDKKPVKHEGLKKTEAVVNGKSVPVSTKYAIAICNYIRNKNIDTAISMLEPVLILKKAIPMRGEIPHKKGKIMSGRYPVNAAKEFIKLLKSLKTNALVNELELENYVIFCKADVAQRPYRRFGRTRFKRTHITLKLIQPVKKKNMEENKNGE